MNIPKKNLQQRILDALVQFPDGHAIYTHLMYKVWPHDEYPRAYRHPSKGGPPGVAWVFGNALSRMQRDGLISRPSTTLGGHEQRYGQRDIRITSAGKKLVA